MVRLFFFIYLVPPCFSGFDYLVSSSCDFMVLRKREVLGYFYFYFSGIYYFNSALL